MPGSGRPLRRLDPRPDRLILRQPWQCPYAPRLANAGDFRSKRAAGLPSERAACQREALAQADPCLGWLGQVTHPRRAIRRANKGPDSQVSEDIATKTRLHFDSDRKIQD